MPVQRAHRPTDPGPPRIPIHDARRGRDSHILASKSPFQRVDFQRWLRGRKFTGVRVDSGHPNRFDPSRLGSETFHILNWALPHGMTEEGDITPPIAWTVDEFANTIPLIERQRRGYNTGWNFEQDALENEYVLIRDHAGVPIALHHENWLAVLQCLCHDSRNQSRLFAYLIDQFMATMAGGGTWTPRSLIVNDVESVTEIFVKLFNSDMEKTERERDAAVRNVENTWKMYMECISKYEDVLRRLEGGREEFSTEDEFVRSRAESVLTSLRSNPLICGLSVCDETLRVVTKPLPSHREARGSGEYYRGLRRLVVQIPLTFGRIRRVRNPLRVHSLGANNRLSSLPSKEGYFWDDGGFCLGNVRGIINKNILSGDWDMVVMLILRGIVGVHDMKRYSQIYREAAAAEAEAVAAAEAVEHPPLEEEEA